MHFEISYIFPIFTTIASFLFFMSVVEQYKRKHKPHQLVWAVSMFLFCITAGAEAFSLIYGSWNSIVYRTYYLFAAIQVSLMGGGLLYLFTSRNIINERNSGKASIIFGIVWVLFSALFIERSPIFYAVLIPALIITLGGILYQLVNFIDKARFRNAERVNICFNCRTYQSIESTTCVNCGNAKFVTSNQSSAYTSFYQRLFRGHNFSHMFLGMAIYLFILMNLYVWTLPLNTTVLKTGGQVSGTAWQMDPTKNAPSDRAIIRLFSPLHTVPGAIALIGGGVYSYISWQLSIRRFEGHFKPMTGIFNIYIAFGAWSLGLGATLSGFGLGTLYFSEVISVTFMYLGFLESDQISKDKFTKLFKFSWIWRKEEKSIPS